MLLQQKIDLLPKLLFENLLDQYKYSSKHVDKKEASHVQAANATYVTDNCMNPIDRLMFNAARAPTRRLQPIAILQNMPSVRSIPGMQDDIAKVHKILDYILAR